MLHKPSIIIISGKNPLTSTGGYASYGRNLGFMLKSLGYSVTIYCVGRQNEQIKTVFGTIIVCASPLFRLSLIRNMAMVAFPVFCIQMAFRIQKFVQQKTIIWGIGPWSLTGVVLNKLFRKRVILLADYFTTIQHEFNGRVIGMPVRDYGLIHWVINRLVLVTLVPFYSFSEKIVLNNVSKIVTHYKSTNLIISKKFTFSPENLLYLPYVVDTDIPKKTISQKQKAKKKIVVLGRQDGRKGVNVFLHACAILEKKTRDFTAYILGSGELEIANKKLAQKLGLSQVIFLGHVDNPDRYLTGSIFVLPSIEEGSSSFSLLEAMGKGLPIVASNIDGIPEDITNTVSGLLVRPNRPTALAHALEQLLFNKNLAKKLGENAKKEYRAKYQRTEAIQHVKRFLKTLG